MKKQIVEFELFDPSDEYDDFTKYYISKTELCELFNVSKAWIDKIFKEDNIKKLVYVTRIRYDKNGEKEIYGNKHTYYLRDYVKGLLSTSKWYEFIGSIEEYEALKKTGELFFCWEEIDGRGDVNLESIHAGYRMPKGGMREKTAIKNGYLKIVIGRITLYYDPNDKGYFYER